MEISTEKLISAIKSLPDLSEHHIREWYMPGKEWRVPVLSDVTIVGPNTFPDPALRKDLVFRVGRDGRSWDLVI